MLQVCTCDSKGNVHCFPSSPTRNCRNYPSTPRYDKAVLVKRGALLLSDYEPPVPLPLPLILFAAWLRYGVGS